MTLKLLSDSDVPQFPRNKKDEREWHREFLPRRPELNRCREGERWMGTAEEKEGRASVAVAVSKKVVQRDGVSGSIVLNLALGVLLQTQLVVHLAL
jgi:hypothetical protein